MYPKNPHEEAIINFINSPHMTGKFICSSCGSLSDPKKVNKGSGAVEIVLWFFFIVPGLIYSVWRRSNKNAVCSVCGNKSLVPITSPIGMKMVADQGLDLKQIQKDAEEAKAKDKKQLLYTAVGLAVLWFIFMALSH